MTAPLRPPSFFLQWQIRDWIERLGPEECGGVGWGDWRWMKEAGLFPLHLSAAFFWYVKPEGAVFVEDNDRFGHVVDPEECLCAAVNALAQAARRRPELAELLPERPAGARDCPRCGGTGDEDSWGPCLCAGLGWVGQGATM